ncbi:tetratricopeptide repeat protein [Hymenobacter rubripertinctus]|uniref:Tetratricopeptide repeat protein n=1 Tax=Hymenobacter rubripertinctus TaxID=2029981 RepID=A0A418QLW1_9BACT|nr:tetratricopeptide repeat protein [Hymenobacter rubripertinctus]RIY06134.1 tetratricopeptide repeat protein [Hymenobacter rubripertinctus]
MMPTPPGSRWQEAAQNLLALHRPQQAEQLLRQHLAQNPREVLAHIMLSFALYQQNQLAEARAAVAEALALNPAASEGYYVLCLLENRAGQFGPRDHAIREALRLQPFNPKYLGMQARILLVQAQPAAAQLVAERGLAHTPTHQDCLVARAQALHAQQHWPELTGALHQLRAAHPTLPKAHLLLGQEAMRQDQFAAAQAHFQEVLRLAPTDEQALQGASQAIRRQTGPGRIDLQFDRYMTFVTEGMKFPRPQWKAWGHFLLILLPLSFFCIPILLALAFERVYWRLHPAVRRLRNRPDAATSYAHETLYRYGSAATFALLILALLPGLIWLLEQWGLGQSMGAGLTGGLTAVVMAIMGIFKQASAAPVPEKSPLGWVLLATLVLAACVATACWPATWPYGPPLSLLVVGLLFYIHIRRLRTESNR